MTPDLIQMAREAGFTPVDTADEGGKAVYTHMKGITQELERFATLVRNATLEEAAQLDWTEIMREGQLVTWGDAETLGDRVLEKIRNLKDKT